MLTLIALTILILMALRWPDEAAFLLFGLVKLCIVFAMVSGVVLGLLIAFA